MKVRGLKRRDQSTFGAIDYGLMAAGNCFAVYSAGMSMGNSDVAWWFVYAVLAGSLFSLLIRRLSGNSALVRVDSFLYAGATICAVICTRSLNMLLPGDGIPPDVITAGWLCWMLTFGSALTWRDRTLLFQAVPTIALFGLVGCYDTYKSAPFLFFGFLLCLATLLGRSHSREMLRQAVESGYFNRADAPNTPSMYPEQSPELYEDIKKGPWRWLAGPEWALLSGLAIVLVSLLGAPVIQVAVQPLAGVIHVNSPRNQFHTTVLPTVPISPSTYEVGKGPLFDLGRKPIALYLAKLDRLRYLRTGSFDRYTGRGWESSYLGAMAETDDGPNKIAIREIPPSDQRPYRISIQPETGSPTLPLPAEVENASGPVIGITIRQDGGGIVEENRPSTIDIDAVESQAVPRDAQKSLPPWLRPTLDISSLRPAVKGFADAAVRGQGTDFDKANALLQAIGRRCDYSMAATAVPPDADAVDFFLNNSRVGYCDLFATAMVMCARAEGIPARYVLGYLPDPANMRSDGITVIVDRDYHAWAELYFKHVGWVVFDATSAAHVRRDRFLGSDTIWSSIMPVLMDGMIAIGALVLGAIWLWPRLKKRGVRRSLRTEIEREYLAFAKELMRAAKRRRAPSETPYEYLLAVRPHLHSGAEAAERLTEQFVQALYAPPEVAEAFVHGLRSEIKAFRKLVRQGRVRESG